VFGDYTLESQGAPRKITVAAAVGVAVSRPGDSLCGLLGRADEAMYREKRAPVAPVAGA
jgi:GGDEF domain-containing protein